MPAVIKQEHTYFSVLCCLQNHLSDSHQQERCSKTFPTQTVQLACCEMLLFYVSRELFSPSLGEETNLRFRFISPPALALYESLLFARRDLKGLWAEGRAALPGATLPGCAEFSSRHRSRFSNEPRLPERNKNLKQRRQWRLIKVDSKTESHLRSVADLVAISQRPRTARLCSQSLRGFQGFRNGGSTTLSRPPLLNSM